MPDPTAARLRLVARLIAAHEAEIVKLTAERNRLIRTRRGELYSYREIAVDAGVSWVRVGEILRTTP